MKLLRLLIPGLVAAALVLTGCGDDDDAQTDSGSEAAAESGSEPATDGATDETLAEGEQLSANDATEDELQTIPGVGPEIAHEIVEYRPYDAETGPDKFREEMSKYISDDEIEEIMVYLNFDG